MKNLRKSTITFIIGLVTDTLHFHIVMCAKFLQIYSTNSKLENAVPWSIILIWIRWLNSYKEKYYQLLDMISMFTIYIYGILTEIFSESIMVIDQQPQFYQSLTGHSFMTYHSFAKPITITCFNIISRLISRYHLLRMQNIADDYTISNSLERMSSAFL